MASLPSVWATLHPSFGATWEARHATIAARATFFATGRVTVHRRAPVGRWAGIHEALPTPGHCVCRKLSSGNCRRRARRRSRDRSEGLAERILFALLFRWARWSAGEHAFRADVFVDVRPVHALTVTDDLVFRPLGRGGSGKPPRPGKRDADDPTICEIGRDRLVGDLNALDPGFAPSRSAHPMPPEFGMLFNITCTPHARGGRAHALVHCSQSYRKRTGRDPGCRGLEALMDYTARLKARECPLFDTPPAARPARRSPTATSSPSGSRR